MEAYEPFLGFLFIVGVMVLIGRDMIRYAPGQRKEAELERRRRTHTRSHHYKLGDW